jgi:hypothetical protein
MIRSVIVRDIRLSPKAMPMIESSEPKLYAVASNVAAVLVVASARELGSLLDQLANVDERGLVISFTRVAAPKSMVSAWLESAAVSTGSAEAAVPLADIQPLAGWLDSVGISERSR